MSQIKTVMVEDEGHWVALVRHYLKLAGCQIVGIASTQAEALQLVKAKKPDLVTMDERLLNNENGLVVAAAIRRDNPTVAILMITTEGVRFEEHGISKAVIDRGSHLARALMAVLPQ